VNITLTLNEMLDFVGKLDDTEGIETPRERFRRFLQQKVCEVGQIQVYVEECLKNSGDQYNRALQDLVNHIGSILGFDVTFGRYQGIRGKIGFDGHWKSPTGFHIVIEVKTTDVYAIKTATLVGYVDELISEKSVSSWDHALGLYVVARPDSELRQLENAIMAEKRTNQLRIISTKSLLSLVEMMNEYKVAHEEILALLRPSGPKIDPIVDLMARLVAERRSGKPLELKKELLHQEQSLEGEVINKFTPIKSDGKGTIEEEIMPVEQWNIGGLQLGLRITREGYYEPILKALNELGGSAKPKVVLERLAQSMKGVLQDVDYEPLPSGGQRWQKEANFARLEMVKKGLLKSDSRYGTWEITEDGRRYL
jgi:hypothetical protein